MIIGISDTGEVDAIHKLSVKALIKKISAIIGNTQALNGVLIIRQLLSEDIQIHLNIKEEKIRLKKETK